MNPKIPQTQRAIQLTGPDELRYNPAKKVVRPGAHQILFEVEAVGLCFSDLKLLKKFSAHVRKSEVTSGIDQAVLKEVPGYVPGELPGVPGHECVAKVAAVGKGVDSFRIGERYLVETDYRWLRTRQSNAAFGYNFEGGLQQYVILDERVFTSPEGESMMIPASRDISASSVALVEPWACVEDAYASRERTTLKAGGRMLIVADAEPDRNKLQGMFRRFGSPGSVVWVSASGKTPEGMRPPPSVEKNLDGLGEAVFDDVLYFGAEPAVIERLFPRLGSGGLLNIVLCGKKIGRDVEAAIGRVHYGGIRIVGTSGDDPSDSMLTIPGSGELRENEVVNVIGAGGPMGVMHVIRDLCSGIRGVRVYAGDLDRGRLDKLSALALPLASANKAGYKPYLSGKEPLPEAASYIVVMAPVPAIVASAVRDAAEGGIINIFAGIAAEVNGRLDLDAYIRKRLYATGTSGSVKEDMCAVLSRVESGRLDTDISVAAVCGMEAAVEGIRAVEKQLIPGKIIVYPSCAKLPLTPLEKLKDSFPRVAAKLDGGRWTHEAEKALLEEAETR